MAADPHHVRSHDGRSATLLELHADAASHCLLAWAYPSDMEVRVAAEIACGLTGIDYMTSLVRGVSSCGPEITDAASLAQRAMFVGYIDKIVALSKAGAVPREGILCTGRPADGLGYDTEEYV